MIRTKRPRIWTMILEASSSDYSHIVVYGLENFEDGSKRIWRDGVEIIS